MSNHSPTCQRTTFVLPGLKVLVRTHKMLEVNCAGSPRSVGITHGRTARASVHGSLAFYKGLFQTKCKMEWPAAKSFALKFQPYLEQHWPQYVSEMKGVAEGAELSYEDILALNVRTEIAFGSFNDGCTGISWKGEGKSLLGQNWDWNIESAPQFHLPSFYLSLY
jgi:isopenicillin-N N-acyltransferase-like protein